MEYWNGGMTVRKKHHSNIPSLHHSAPIIEMTYAEH